MWTLECQDIQHNYIQYMKKLLAPVKDYVLDLGFKSYSWIRTLSLLPSTVYETKISYGKQSFHLVAVYMFS